MNTENLYDYDVFLCFASADKEQAKAIYYQMSLGGLRLFWANVTLKKNIGQSFFSVIQDALTHSEHFVLICTNNSMESNWVQEEYEAFFSQCYIPSNKVRRLFLSCDTNFDKSLLPTLLKNIQISTSINEIIKEIGGVNFQELLNEKKKLKDDILLLQSKNQQLEKKVISINHYIEENKELKIKIENMSEKFSSVEKEDVNLQKKLTKTLNALPKKKILIVDDEQTIQTLYKVELEDLNLGYEVHPAFSGEQALELFDDISPDLVILDLNMPGMDGLDALKLLKEKNNKIPVIISTAYPEYKYDLISMAADDWIVKSSNTVELINSVKKHLKEKTSNQID
ncbi:MAG: response regulator [Deltaproteobacteria bacterium]|nr:response regulator [Deltaproteobacteria bacterium]MDL1961844.1 response regulator [Deltaproteobacteria bacterium]